MSVQKLLDTPKIKTHIDTLDLDLKNGNKENNFFKQATTQKDFSILKLVLVLNVMHFVYIVTQSISKDCLVNRGVGVVELSFFRNTFIMPAAFYMGRKANQNVTKIEPQYKYLVYTRSILGTFGFFFSLTGVMFLPLSINTVVTFCGPFFTAILSYYILHESINLFEVIAMFISFGGIVLLAMAKPEEGDQQNEVIANLDNPFFSNFTVSQRYMMGILSSFIACVLFSVICVVTRMMKGCHYSIIQFNYSLISSLFCFVILIIKLCWELFRFGTNNPDHPIAWPFVFGDALGYPEVFMGAMLNFVGTSLMTTSNQNANPALVQLIGYISVCYAFLSDRLVFKVEFNKLQIIGLAVVIVCNAGVIANRTFNIPQQL